jgi:hypothetical protein
MGSLEQESKLHRIETDLSENWIEEWAAAGVKDLGIYLGSVAITQRLENGEITPLEAQQLGEKLKGNVS